MSILFFMVIDTQLHIITCHFNITGLLS